MKVLVLLGSLRSASFSRKVALAARSLAPEGMTLEMTDGRDLPLFDQDLEAGEKPPAVQTLLDQIDEADGLLFVTPEFNCSIPGTLKNLVDWASRPPFRSPIKGKPSTIVSLSPAPTGGARAHKELTSVLGATLTPTLVAPGFTISAVHEKFDEAGALIDDPTKVRLERTLVDFQTWAAGIAD